MKAVIILGCEGHQVDGFEFCNGINNVILDLETIELTSNYINLIKYLNDVIKIFDAPCVKPHLVSNAIYKIYEMGYISDQMNKYIAHFYELHKRCGLILLCLPKSNA